MKFERGMLFDIPEIVQREGAPEREPDEVVHLSQKELCKAIGNLAATRVGKGCSNTAINLTWIVGSVGSGITGAVVRLWWDEPPPETTDDPTASSNRSDPSS